MLQQVATQPPQSQKTIHFLMAVPSRPPCQACTQDGGGRVLDTQPSAGTLDTNIDQRLPAGTAARTKIKHPRSARAGCDRHTHHGEENLRHRPHMLHESATDAFAMQSNPSNCSWCNTQKLEFCIHCCSTCHALLRSHMNLGIEAHTLFTNAFGCARPFKHRTRHHTRSSAHPVLLQQCSKLLEPMCQGSVSPARLG